jgi:hypothetical protein
MSGWWSLPRAAPVLLRHLIAYAELAEQDFAVARRQRVSRVIALAAIALAGLFTLSLICLAVVAATWDTPHRMNAIYGLIGVFAAALLLAIGRLARINAQSQPFLASVKREWALDRIILDQIMSGGHGGHGGHGEGGTHTQGEAHG